MKYDNIKTDGKGFEYKKYRDPTFPFSCSTTRLSRYRDNRFNCHWHDEPELTLVLDGEMEYQVNDKVFHLTAGMGIFANSNVLHSGWNSDGKDCTYSPVCFRTSLISGRDNSIIEKKYVDPLNYTLPYLVLSPGEPRQRDILNILTLIRGIKYNGDSCAELTIQSYLYRLWALLFAESCEKSANTVKPRGIDQIKNAITYMEANYPERLTLENIADSCNLSKSEFCRTFKRLAHQTPFEYLLRLRIRKSLDLLSGTDMSVTEISEATGFASPSYYAETFRRFIDCSPSEYAKKRKENINMQ